MSKMGRKAIALPEGVQCSIDEGSIKVSGKLGELTLGLIEQVKVTLEDNQVVVAPSNSSVTAKKLWGTFRSLINNMAEGVSQGFTKKLEITGVGYRVNLKGNKLVMQLGFSHDVEMDIPSDLKVTCPDTTHIDIFGIDKQKVGSMASLIRKHKKPEPYKGKGFKYVGEHILRKEGKKK